MSEENDVIHPEEWTTKELVKHIYRELKKIEDKLTNLEQDVSELKDDMKIRKARDEERSKENARLIGITALIVGALSLLIDFIVGFFK